MPGMIEHFYFCQLIYNSLSNRPATTLLKNGDLKLPTEYKQWLNRENFMLGGILPDMAEERNIAHCKVEHRKIRGLYVPDLYSAERQLYVSKNWSLRMGIYAHLYLDRYFLLNFLVPKFGWDINGRHEIINCSTGEIFTVSEFFSPEGLYGAYSELNVAIINGGLLNLEAIKKLPEELPKTGIKVLDQTIAEPWQKQLEKYTTHLSERTDRIFSIDEYLEFAEKAAVRLTAEMLHME